MTKKTSKKNIAGKKFFYFLKWTWFFSECFFYLPKLNVFFFENRQQFNVRAGQKKTHVFFGNARPKSTAHIKICKCLVWNLSNMSNFYPLEVVGQCSKTRTSSSRWILFKFCTDIYHLVYILDNVSFSANVRYCWPNICRHRFFLDWLFIVNVGIKRFRNSVFRY